jgi:Spy/CpxP family protein refolding chaperone
MGFGGQEGVGGTLRLLTNAAVQKDLELTQDQIDKIKKIDESYQEDVEEGRGNFDFQGLQDLSEEERGKKMAELREKMTAQTKKLNEKYQPKLEKAVDKAHLDRIKQIQRQQAGIMALRSKDVIEALALSEDQQKQVDSVFTASQEEMQKLFPRGGPGGPGGRGGAGAAGGAGGAGGGAGGAGGEANEADETARRERFQKMQEQMQKLNEDRDTKLMAVLTDEQKAKFEELKGKPFDVSQLRGRGFGGPGGPGGGGRGGPGGRPGGPRERPPM